MPVGVIDQLHNLLYIWFALLGFNLGVLITLLCCRLDRVRAERYATGRVCSEPETVSLEVSQPRGVIDWIELPSGAQVCCGDCYARLLLSKMDLPQCPISLRRRSGRLENNLTWMSGAARQPTYHTFPAS